jgi:hypothetical protein
MPLNTPASRVAYPLPICPTKDRLHILRVHATYPILLFFFLIAEMDVPSDFNHNCLGTCD